MQKILIVVGCQRDKLEKIDRGSRNKILDFIHSTQHTYDGTIAVVRNSNMSDADNFRRKKDTIGDDRPELIEFSADNIIEVSGYDLDCKVFRKDAEYHIIGVSTGAAVLCTAMSMYSAGLRVTVLSKYCADRKGMHKEAIAIMNAYMEGCVK